MMTMSRKAAGLFLGVLAGFFFFTERAFPDPEDAGAGEEAAVQRTIPEALLRPQRGEAPRYPLDIVIGTLGRGEASAEAYLFAGKIAAALVAGNPNDPSLQAMDSESVEAFMSALNEINPQSCRLGSGREEPDGAVSFLVRFLGRERGVTGELYVRARKEEQPYPAAPAETDRQLELDGQAGEQGPSEETGTSETAAETAVQAVPDTIVWQFEDLMLEEAQDRGEEADHRFDFPPYERFF
jgi:hypothetical protein